MAEVPEEELGFENLIARLAIDSVVPLDGEQALDLDLFRKLLFARAIPTIEVNRAMFIGELRAVRDEQHVQRVRRDAEGGDQVECAARLGALEARERTILDQLWPVP